LPSGRGSPLPSSRSAPGSPLVCQRFLLHVAGVGGAAEVAALAPAGAAAHAVVVVHAHRPSRRAGVARVALHRAPLSNCISGMWLPGLAVAPCDTYDPLWQVLHCPVTLMFWCSLPPPRCYTRSCGRCRSWRWPHRRSAGTARASAACRRPADRCLCGSSRTAPSPDWVCVKRCGFQAVVPWQAMQLVAPTGMCVAGLPVAPVPLWQLCSWCRR